MKYQHSDFIKPDSHHPLQVPIYQSVAFEFDSAEDMEAAFTGISADHTYSRISNPTVQFFEERVKNITGAMSVTALNSGMAAISNAVLTLGKAGGNIITSPHLFGNTYSFFFSTLKSYGMDIRVCDLNQTDQVLALMDAQTCAIFFEVVTNPQLEVVDIAKLSKIAHEHHIPIIADTTVVPFCAWSASEFGIDIELISSTKYISGGATSLGGLILDYGHFDWNQTPALSNHAIQFGNQAFTQRLKKEIHRNIGAYMTPHVAYQQTLGLEILPLRFEKAAGNCLALAESLSSVPEIVAVNYTGLKDNPFYEISSRQFGKYPGAKLTFDLKSKAHCFAFLNKLKVIKRATNLFDNKTLAIHPASTIFGNFSKEIQTTMDIRDTTIRLSLGIEDLECLEKDILNSLK
jgi:O-acetylhomoserine (thiol)-lyase